MINFVATVGGVNFMSNREHSVLMKISLNKLQKKYDDAVKNNVDVFTYDGAEILTSYAKYLLEYLKMEQNNE